MYDNFTPALGNINSDGEGEGEGDGESEDGDAFTSALGGALFSKP